MHESLSQLTTKRLLVVTGKGGTGKSVFATALAAALAAVGDRRVLLAELGRAKDRHFMRLHELLATKELSHKPRVIVNPIEATTEVSAMRIDPFASLSEYLELKLKSRRLPSLLLNNKITRSFLDVIPGLTELVCIGNLWHLTHQEDENGEAVFDTVILDAPASGNQEAAARDRSENVDLPR